VVTSKGAQSEAGLHGSWSQEREFWGWEGGNFPGSKAKGDSADWLDGLVALEELEAGGQAFAVGARLSRPVGRRQ
jgi:hypothetical protein